MQRTAPQKRVSNHWKNEKKNETKGVSSNQEVRKKKRTKTVQTGEKRRKRNEVKNATGISADLQAGDLFEQRRRRVA